jgi:hypothetical protein
MHWPSHKRAIARMDFRVRAGVITSQQHKLKTALSIITDFQFIIDELRWHNPTN